MSWEDFHHVTGIVADVTLVLAAIAAIIKFRLVNEFGHKWRSELTSTHRQLNDGSIVFTADYTLQNTGTRTLHVTGVRLRLVLAKTEERLLVPDETKVLAERALLPTDSGLLGNFQIEGGERTVFPLRCRLDSLPDVVFVLCDFDLKQKRAPTVFRGLYCKTEPHDESSTAHA